VGAVVLEDVEPVEMRNLERDLVVGPVPAAKSSPVSCKKTKRMLSWMGSILFIYMALDTLDSSEFSNPVQEVLSKTQKAVLDRVMAILEHDPKLNAVLTEKFQKNFLDIVSDAGKFNLLMEKIGSTEMQKLWEIQREFDTGKKTGTDAIQESKAIIEHYTSMKLSALKGSTNTPESPTA
jgi:hypothetical protein